LDSVGLDLGPELVEMLGADGISINEIESIIFAFRCCRRRFYNPINVDRAIGYSVILVPCNISYFR
jgi:hypothetical protein